jgi:hypothetical protein
VTLVTGLGRQRLPLFFLLFVIFHFANSIIFSLSTSTQLAREPEKSGSEARQSDSHVESIPP